MRKHKKGRILGRVKKVRVALVRSLATNLIEKGAITTTEAKAKELRPFVERLVTFGKTGTKAHERLIVSRLGGNGKATSKLVKDIAPKYKDRAGGYTRIAKLPPRKADGAKMARISFV
jgi:large subunit ribosomal protein L17